MFFYLDSYNNNNVLQSNVLTVMSACNWSYPLWPQETSPPSAMSQNSFPPLSAAPAADETSQVAKENVVSDQVHIEMIAHLRSVCTWWVADINGVFVFF